MAEKPTTPNAVYAARPTVRVDTQDYPKVSELILSMEMIESEGGMSALELKLSNIASDSSGGADFAFEDESIVKLGSQISVYCGDVTRPQEVFQGQVTGFEAEFPEADPPTLMLLAEDVFQAARMTRRDQGSRRRDAGRSDFKSRKTTGADTGHQWPDRESWNAGAAERKRSGLCAAAARALRCRHAGCG